MPTMISKELAGVVDWLVGRERRRAAGMLDRPEWHCLRTAKSPDEEGTVIRWRTPG